MVRNLPVTLAWGSSGKRHENGKVACVGRLNSVELRLTYHVLPTRKDAAAIIAGDKAAAQSVFQESVAVIDRIADKRIIHKNKASRQKSRLSARIKALAA